jgi:hypothetical protein
VRDAAPQRPWRVEPYGFSLSDVRDAGGNLVLNGLNIALAELIVKAVNKN